MCTRENTATAIQNKIKKEKKIESEREGGSPLGLNELENKRKIILNFIALSSNFLLYLFLTPQLYLRFSTGPLCTKAKTNLIKAQLRVN